MVNKKFGEEVTAKIVAELEKGTAVEDIAEELGVAKSQIEAVKSLFGFKARKTPFWEGKEKAINAKTKVFNVSVAALEKKWNCELTSVVVISINDSEKIIRLKFD